MTVSNTTSTNSTTVTPSVTNPYLAQSVGVSFILTVIFIASIVLNTLFILIFLRSKYNKDKSNYLLVNLAIADLVATVFWVLPSLITAAAWNWLLGDGLCKFQGVMASWCYYVNMHTFVIIAFERCLRFWYPSKHEEVFYKTVVFIMIFGIWVFDFVIAMFPIMGWSVLAYSMPQFHCTFSHVESPSHLLFTFFVIFLFPLIGCAALYGLTFFKIKKVKAGTEEGKQAILENKKGKSSKRRYVEMYREAQKKLEDSNKTPGMEKLQKGGKESKKSPLDAKFVGDYEPEGPKDLYVLSESDVKLTITLVILWVVYLLLWFPFIVMNFYWAYNYRNPPVDGAVTTITLFTYFGLVIKPVIYVTNFEVRSSVKEGIKKPNKTEDHL